MSKRKKKQEVELPALMQDLEDDTVRKENIAKFRSKTRKVTGPMGVQLMTPEKQKEVSANGGRASRRELTSEDAKEMQRKQVIARRQKRVMLKVLEEHPEILDALKDE